MQDSSDLMNRSRTGCSNLRNGEKQNGMNYCIPALPGDAAEGKREYLWQPVHHKVRFQCSRNVEIPSKKTAANGRH